MEGNPSTAQHSRNARQEVDITNIQSLPKIPLEAKQWPMTHTDYHPTHWSLLILKKESGSVNQVWCGTADNKGNGGCAGAANVRKVGGTAGRNGEQVGT